MWVREDSGAIRCSRHGQRFDPTGATPDISTSCAGCDADPEGAVEDELVPTPKPPAGCLSTEQLERELIADANEIRRLRNKLSGKTKPKPAPRPKNVVFSAEPDKPPEPVVLDTHAYNSIAKLQDARTKILRLAAELALAREHEHHVRELKRLKRQMGGSH